MGKKPSLATISSCIIKYLWINLSSGSKPRTRSGRAMGFPTPSWTASISQTRFHESATHGLLSCGLCHSLAIVWTKSQLQPQLHDTQTAVMSLIVNDQYYSLFQWVRLVSLSDALRSNILELRNMGMGKRESENERERESAPICCFTSPNTHNGFFEPR